MKKLILILFIFLFRASSFAQLVEYRPVEIPFPDSFLMPGNNDQPNGRIISYTVKKIQLYGNLKLEYAEQGDSTGIPVIFLHGITDSRHSFDLILEHLPSNIHAFALSQRGHGNSDKPLKGYKPEDFADDVAEFMKLLDIRQAVIVGHSMGSAIAQAFAVKHSQQTAAVILVGSFANFNNNLAVIGFQQLVADLKDPVDIDFIREFQKSTIMREVPSSFFETAVNESAKLPAYVWKEAINGLMLFDYTHQLKTIKKQVLIIWGNKDELTSSNDQQLLHDSIAGSKLSIYMGSGHAVHWEEPLRFASEISQFILEAVHSPVAKMKPLFPKL